MHEKGAIVMRRQTALKTVHRDEPVRRNSEKGAVTRSMRGVGAGETRRLASVVGEMERLIDEVFHRPLAGFTMTPFRNMLHEFGGFGDMTPRVDMFEEKGNVVVKADLPGLKREDIEVKLTDNTLTITGENRWEEKVERKDFLRLERSHGIFTRTLNLPDGLKLDEVTANFKDGVLEITIPRLEGAGSVRKVTVG
jgi:HSP20 family protein